MERQRGLLASFISCGSALPTHRPQHGKSPSGLTGETQGSPLKQLPGRPWWSEGLGVKMATLFHITSSFFPCLSVTLVLGLLLQPPNHAPASGPLQLTMSSLWKLLPAKLCTVSYFSGSGYSLGITSPDSLL